MLLKFGKLFSYYYSIFVSYSIIFYFYYIISFLIGYISNFITLLANLKDEKLSPTLWISGDIVTIRDNKLLPHNEFYKIFVNYESLYGIYLFILLLEVL